MPLPSESSEGQSQVIAKLNPVVKMGKKVAGLNDAIDRSIQRVFKNHITIDTRFHFGDECFVRIAEYLHFI